MQKSTPFSCSFHFSFFHLICNFYNPVEAGGTVSLIKWSVAEIFQNSGCLIVTHMQKIIASRVAFLRIYFVVCGTKREWREISSNKKPRQICMLVFNKTYSIVYSSESCCSWEGGRDRKMTFLFTELSAVDAWWNLYPFNNNSSLVPFCSLDFSHLLYKMDTGSKTGHFTCFSSAFSSEHRWCHLTQECGFQRPCLAQAEIPCVITESTAQNNGWPRLLGGTEKWVPSSLLRDTGLFLSKNVLHVYKIIVAVYK